MLLKKCRNCKSKNISILFTLGKLTYTGRFPKKINQKIKNGELNIVICKDCELVQLGNHFDLKYLYGPNYGYRTGINQTMTEHVKAITKYLSKKTKLKKGDSALDIASNDGTLLNFYNKKITTLGIDPLVNKYKKFYKNINYKISNFFDHKKITKIHKKKI